MKFQETILLAKPIDKVGKALVKNFGDTLTLIEITSHGPSGKPQWKLRGKDAQETWIDEIQKHLKFRRLQ